MPQVLSELEAICDQCIANLVDKGVPLDPSESEYDFWDLVQEIREAIHDMGFGIAQGKRHACRFNCWIKVAVTL